MLVTLSGITRLLKEEQNQNAISPILVMEREKNRCRAWYEGDPILEEYHDNEWCKVNHDDNFQFEMLCLEGASVGLSWKTILHKRANYRDAFHDFQIDACSEMTDEELENLMLDSGIIRNRSKIFSVRKNAQAVKKIQAQYGSFDAYSKYSFFNKS